MSEDNLPDLLRQVVCHDSDDLETLWSAAEEIERLKKALQVSMKVKEEIVSDLIKNLRDLAAFAHADLSVADEAADEIERLRAALSEYVKTVVEMEGVTFVEQMKNAELRLCIESILAKEPQG